MQAEPAPTSPFSTNAPKFPLDQLVTARKEFPYPIAHSLRALDRAHTAKDKYDAVLETAEALAITLSVTAAALLHHQINQTGNSVTAAGAGPELRQLSDLRNILLGKGATFGAWTNWLDGLTTDSIAEPQIQNALPGLHDSLQDTPSRSGLVTRLNSLRVERNQSAHGNRPQSEPEAALRAEDQLVNLKHALAQSKEFLARHTWLLTISSAYQLSSGDFEISAHQATGDHPEFERTVFRSPGPVGDNVVYVRGKYDLSPLTPFVAYLFCPSCAQMELSYAYRTQKNGPAFFRSFARGHEIESLKLGDEIRSLPAIEGRQRGGHRPS